MYQAIDYRKGGGLTQQFGDFFGKCVEIEEKTGDGAFSDCFPVYSQVSLEIYLLRKY
jgi:hypothetical protein